MRQDGKRLNLEGIVPVRQWRIHVGAHKTATTHLQDTLALVRDRLAAGGPAGGPAGEQAGEIDFIPTRPLMREQRFAEVLGQRRPIARLPILGPAHMRDAIEARVEPVRIGPEVVVLSEENILGVPHHILTPTFYPQASQQIGRLASLGLRADLRLFLSIRSYDTLLPSAYAEALKYAAPPPGGFAATRARFLATPPSWFDLVSRIDAAAPTAPLRIWRQEDYRANDHAIMEVLCGCPLGPLPTIPDPVRTRSPSAAAIAVAETLPAGLSYEERLALVREIYATVEPGQARFQPFDEAERLWLRARYEADLERIARVFPDMLMAFHSRELAA